MKNKKENKKPCSECPYELGLIMFFRNPCPDCIADGYKACERYKNMLMTNGQMIIKDDKK